MRYLLIGFLLIIAIAGEAAAASRLTLTLRDGRVWLTADDVPLRVILAEWGRVGQTRIVNGEQVAGGPVTMRLEGVPEETALNLLLKSASGFVAVPRSDFAPVSSTSSRFESVLVLGTAATSQAPAAAAAAPATPAGPVTVSGFRPTFGPGRAGIPIAPGVQRLVGADGRPVPDDQERPTAEPPRAPAVAGPPAGFAPQQPVATPPESATTVPQTGTPPGFDEPPRTAPPSASPPATPATTPASKAAPAPGVLVPGMVASPPQAPQTSPAGRQ